MTSAPIPRSVAGTALPYRLLSRAVRPFSVAIMIATATVGYQYLVFDRWAEGPWSNAVGAFAFAAAFILFIGWLVRSERIHETGLLLCAAVWAGQVASTAMAEGLDSPSVWFAFAWMVGAMGAWALESYDHRWRHGA